LLWLGSASALTQTVSWLFTLLIARMLTPADYGLFAIAGVYIGILEFLNEFGIGSTIVQKENITRKEVSGLFALSLYWSIALCSLTYCFASKIAITLHSEELVPILRVLSFSFIISAFKNIQYNMMVREMRFREIAKIEALARILTALLSYLLALQGFGVWTLVSSYLVYSFIQACCYSLRQRIYFAFRLSFSDLKEHIVFGLQIISGRFIEAISGRTQTMVIGKLLGMDLLGVYTFAQVLSFRPIEMIVTVLNQVFFPIYSRLQNDENTRTNYLLKTMEIEMLCILPLCLIMACTADIFIPLILGDRWISTIPYMQVFSVLAIFIFLSSQATMLSISAGKPRLQILYVAVSFALLVGFFFLLGTHGKEKGILLSWIIVCPPVSLLYFGLMLRNLHVPLLSMLRSIVLPCAVATSVTVTTLVCKRIWSEPHWINLIAILTTSGAAGISSLLVFDRKKVGNVIQTLRSAV